MSPTPEERLKLKRFGLIVANCFLPGLGNGIFVDRRHFGILAAWLVCQLVLQNPFPYFAFLAASITYGLVLINRSPQAINLRLRMQDAARLGDREEERHRPNTPMGRTDPSYFASDRLKEKQDRAARILAQDAAIEQELELANSKTPVDEPFDPTVPLNQSWGHVDSDESPSDKSWLQAQLEQALQSQTDPGALILRPLPGEHDPWQQQQTDPAAPVTGEHDPWQQQMTDPAAPQPVAEYASAFTGLSSIESTGSLLSDSPRAEVLGGLQASGLPNSLPALIDPTVATTGSALLATASSTDPLGSGTETASEDNLNCHNCGYKRDHDFAFCPQCANFF